MKITNIGHTSDYNLSLVANLFFAPDEDVFIKSTANKDSLSYEVKTEIEFLNKTYTASFSAPISSLDEFELRRLENVVCGMSLFLCAKKIKDKILPWGTITGIRPSKQVRQMIEEKRPEEEIYGFFKKYFAISDKKFDLALNVAKNELSVIKENRENDIALYIGIPFCPTRCLYCSFVSTDLNHSKKYVEPYLLKLKEEIKFAASLLRETDLNIKSVYIGGGTPTSITAFELENLLDALYSNFDLSKTTEFCVEAGRPDTITKEKLVALKNYGVDRISINPQSMNEKTLKLIGRSHTPEDIKTAFSLAREVGFKTINADVIAALPGETLDDFVYTLNEIEKYSPENITVHTMSIKRGSALHQSLSGYDLTKRETAEAMLDFSQEFMRKTNRLPYYMYRQKNMMGNLENVGYSKEGHFSTYNINIMEEVLSILALGAGGSGKAISRDKERIERVFNFKGPIEYISRFDEILEKKKEFFAILKELNK